MLDIENGLLRDHPFNQKLGKRKVKFMQEMLTMVEPYVILEEKLYMRFDNPASADFHSSRPIGKESHRHWDGPNRGMLGKYNKYTPLTVSSEKIYQDCINAKF